MGNGGILSCCNKSPKVCKEHSGGDHRPVFGRTVGRPKNFERRILPCDQPQEQQTGRAEEAEGSDRFIRGVGKADPDG